MIKQFAKAHWLLISMLKSQNLMMNNRCIPSRLENLVQKIGADGIPTWCMAQVACSVHLTHSKVRTERHSFELVRKEVIPGTDGYIARCAVTFEEHNIHYWANLGRDCSPTQFVK